MIGSCFYCSCNPCIVTITVIWRSGIIYSVKTYVGNTISTISCFRGTISRRRCPSGSFNKNIIVHCPFICLITSTNKSNGSVVRKGVCPIIYTNTKRFSSSKIVCTFSKLSYCSPRRTIIIL